MGEAVNHPKHYSDLSIKTKAIECIDIAMYLNFDLGNAFKYIWRAGYKGDINKEVEDLDKALWYLKHYKENYNRMPKNSELATHIFALLEAPTVFGYEEHKYRALEAVVTGDYQEAIRLVGYMKGDA